MSEVEKIINFVREFYKQHGQVPTARRICREVNISPPKLYRKLGSMESVCERAGIKIDKRMKDRLKQTRKATKKRSRRSVRKHVQKEQASSIVESGHVEQPHVRAFERIRENVQDEEEAKNMIMEKAQCFAEELKTLVLDSNVEVCTAILEALNEILPHVLFYKYDVAADIPDLLSAKDILRQIRKQRKKLRKQQNQLDDERQEIQRGRELLKRDSDKKSLLEHIEKLEWQRKVDIKRFNETYDAFKRFRTLFREIMPVMRKFPGCQKIFVQNMMESHGDVLKWLTSRKMRLSFETEGRATRPSRT